MSESTSRPIQSICVYCGSADGIHPDYYQPATRMGEVLAKANVRIVYGAGKTGLMGAVANGALQAGGEVIGIVPKHLNLPRLIHSGLTRLEVVDNIHLRKARMSELADAFIALPGGYGTFDELFETLTWAQLGLHDKPIGLLNTRRYYDPLITLVQQALVEKFIYAEHRIRMVSDEDPEQLLAMLKSFETPGGLERWLDR